VGVFGSRRLQRELAGIGVEAGQLSVGAPVDGNPQLLSRLVFRETAAEQVGTVRQDDR
jgi:hypothetical protein